MQCYQFSRTNGLYGDNIREAEENEFPFIVSIGLLANVSRDRVHMLHECTGSLVTRQDVLTADHCVRQTFSQGLKVMVGSHDLSQTTDYFPVFIWTYEHWAIYIRRPNDHFPYHDIAFIKLSKNVPASIHLAPYGNIPKELLYGLAVNTAGWGKLYNDTKPRILRTTDLTVLSKDECIARLTAIVNRSVYIDEVRICTIRDPYAVVTKGDSGGPLLYFGVIVGVNHGVVPSREGIYSYQINMHVSLRIYQDFFEDIRVRFHMNYED